MSCFPCHSWNIFAGYRILECEVFSNSWKCCLFFMSTMVFDEKSSIIWIAFFPISKVSFYLFDFKIFFFIYFSDFFWWLILAWISLYLSYLELVQLLGVVGYFLPNFGDFIPFSEHFSTPLSFSSAGILWHYC